MSASAQSPRDPSAILSTHLAQFLQNRTPPKTFCPSEVARALSASELHTLGYSTWRDAMPDIRALAWELREVGDCEVLQRGEVLGLELALEDIRGPIRVRRSEG